MAKSPSLPYSHGARSPGSYSQDSHPQEDTFNRLAFLGFPALFSCYLLKGRVHLLENEGGINEYISLRIYIFFVRAQLFVIYATDS